MDNKLQAVKNHIKIDFDFKNFFVHLTKIATSAATLDVKGTIDEFADTISETFLNSPCERAAYKLLTTAMIKAIAELIENIKKQRHSSY